MAYRSSKVSDCIFEIHHLWQSGFSRVYSNCCCSCSFEPEIIRIGQSSHKMYSNNILNFQESTTILNAYTKKSGTLLNTPRRLHASKKGGRGLTSIEHGVEASIQGHKDYIKKGKERLIIASRNSINCIMINRTTRKQKWEEKQLYGYFK